MQHYRADAALDFAARAAKQPADGIYTPEKQAIHDLEQTDDGLMLSGKYKYRFIDELLTDAVQKPASKPTLSRFDKAALGVHSGKWVALAMILLALGAAMLVAAPIMSGAFLIPPLLSGPLEQLMTSLHVWKPLAEIVFYLLSYPWGGNVSLLVRVGQVISPVTEFFGMTWQMFMAYLSSMLTKESLLGVINALYSNTDIAAAAFNAKSVGISDSIAALLPQVITKAQALGFIMAIVFNVPCTMTVAATYRENHSIKWIALSVGYYVAFSLAISCIFYHIGLLIW